MTLVRRTNVQMPEASAQEDQAIADTMLALLASRAPSASICPSDVARALSSDEGVWRAKMPAIRRVAAQLAANGQVKVTRGPTEVDALSKGGPIRIRRP
jgi:hypothetical protein